MRLERRAEELKNGAREGTGTGAIRDSNRGRGNYGQPTRECRRQKR